MIEKEPEYYHDLLMEIYPCKVPFTVAVKDDKPKKRLGTYYAKTHRIILHVGWSGKYDPVETAIHEYAHHLHYTEFAKAEKKQAPHGREFWQIYGQLMCRAKELGICNGARATVIDFPRVEELPDEKKSFRDSNSISAIISRYDPEIKINEKLPPNLKKMFKSLFLETYNWLNR